MYFLNAVSESINAEVRASDYPSEEQRELREVLPFFLQVSRLAPWVVVAVIWLLRRMKRTMTLQLLIFRTFRREESVYFRTTLAPILGAFGQLRFISNEEYENANASPFKEDETDELGADELGNWSDSEISADESWRAVAERLANQADVAVVDISHVTQNIVWEVSMLMDRLPPWRVLFVSNAHGSGAATHSNVAALYQEKTMCAFPAVFLYGSRVGGLALRFRLCAWMRSLGHAMANGRAPSRRARRGA